jgi:hypothetical protein
MAVVLWAATGWLLFVMAKPTRSPDNGRSMVFDPIALLYATSVAVALAVVPWGLVFMLPRGWPAWWVAGIVSFSTWMVLSASMLFLENYMQVDAQAFKASEVFGDGKDLIFMPIIIPLISLLSGAACIGARGMTRVWNGASKS